MKEKNWTHKPEETVSWKQTHGKRNVITGIVVGNLPKTDKTGNYSVSCEELVFDVHGVLKPVLGDDCPSLEELRFKLNEMTLKTRYDRYLIWVSALGEFRTPGKNLVERGI